VVVVVAGILLASPANAYVGPEPTTTDVVTVPTACGNETLSRTDAKGVALSEAELRVARQAVVGHCARAKLNKPLSSDHTNLWMTYTNNVMYISASTVGWSYNSKTGTSKRTLSCIYRKNGGTWYDCGVVNVTTYASTGTTQFCPTRGQWEGYAGVYDPKGNVLDSDSAFVAV
jgi:hypothetical protein